MEDAIKIFITIAGLLTVILKLVETFTVNQRKKDLVTDLSNLNLSPEDDRIVKDQINRTLRNFLKNVR